MSALSFFKLFTFLSSSPEYWTKISTKLLARTIFGWRRLIIFFYKKKKERKFLSQKGDYNFWFFFSCNQQTCVRTVLKLRNICQTSDVAHGHFVLISHLTSSMCSWSVQFWLISILLPCILLKIEFLTCIKRHEFLWLCIRLCIIIFFWKINFLFASLFFNLLVNY